MWIINSNDVQQARDRLECRRTELETRYAGEKAALDAEFAAIETLERLAPEFAAKHMREDPRFGPTAPAGADPPGGEPAQLQEDAGTAPPPAAEGADPPGEEASGTFDILKPGSRWRLNRGNRASSVEDTPTVNSSASW